MDTGKKVCCFCGKEISNGYGNNAEPAMSGRCCDECNKEVVLPYRLMRLADKTHSTEICLALCEYATNIPSLIATIHPKYEGDEYERYVVFYEPEDERGIYEFGTNHPVFSSEFNGALRAHSEIVLHLLEANEEEDEAA